MELDDGKIFKMAFIVSIIGILGMLIFAGSIEPKEVSINQISRNNIGENVAVTGVVDSFKYSSSGSTCFLTLNDGESKISVIIFESILVEFEDLGTNIESFKGHKVKLIGSITEYHSSMKLILSNANSLKLLD